ncbi:MAG: DNA alkylation repair protein [Alistipes sp.]|nr:DNA alkylation repair protein [Alistipes sp.]
MDSTSRMVALLAAMRRQRNGAVADGMRCYGAACGLNYGVSLPTLRTIARAETPDHDFARLLFRQDVRELRLAALHIAVPESLTVDEAEFWAAGLCNSEIAEEAAFALLHRSPVFPQLFETWISDRRPLVVYAASMAAVRWPAAPIGWCEAAIGAIVRWAALVERGEQPDYAVRLIAQGAVALSAVLGSRNEESRLTVLRAAGRGGDAPALLFLREELAWRLER